MLTKGPLISITRLSDCCTFPEPSLARVKALGDVYVAQAIDALG